MTYMVIFYILLPTHTTRPRMWSFFMSVKGRFYSLGTIRKLDQEYSRLQVQHKKMRNFSLIVNKGLSQNN